MFVSSIVVKKTVAVCKRLQYVQNVLLLDGRKINDFILSLNGLIKRQRHIEFNVNDHVSKIVDISKQVALIFCSSGTTGKLLSMIDVRAEVKIVANIPGQPKGVEITQENILACLQSYHGFVTNIKMLRDRQLINFNIAPWFHVLGFVSMFMYACSDETVSIYIPKFEEHTFYKAIEVTEKLSY